MAKYTATKPRYSKWEWFKFISIRIIFPPILLWDLIKLTVNALLGRFVGGIVIPAQDMDFSYLAITDDTVANYNEEGLVCEKHEITTHDNAHLDTFEIQHSSQSKVEPRYQTYIINLVGNGMCYEQIIDSMKDDAKALQTNVIGFNLRGVNQSKSKLEPGVVGAPVEQRSDRTRSRQDLLTDGIAQVQRLLDRGVSPQNITLKGHSLGAGVATLVAKHFHKLDQPINLFNGSSFSSLTNFVVGHIRLKRDENRVPVGHKESISGKILGWLAKPFIMFGIALAKWEINAGSAYKSIPSPYKDYMVVRSRKDIREHRLDDAIIPHYASIHNDLTSQRTEKKERIEKEVAHIEDLIKYSDPIAKPQFTKAKDLLLKARERIKSERKMETYEASENGHIVRPTSLHNRSGVSAQTFFRKFVERVHVDHAIKAPKIN